MTKFQLNRKDVNKIMEVMDKFPQSKNYELEYHPGAIGYHIEMTVPISIKGQEGTFKIEITDPGDW
jgi:hypothetical protein